MSNGWEESAKAWIKTMGENGVSGDKGRQFVIDPVVSKLIEGQNYKNALDVGCGEGRTCRLLSQKGIKATGIDPTKSLIARARELDSENQYIECGAEDLPFEDNAFDMVIAYLSLIDIPDYKKAIKEMVRVLKPQGDLLIVNMTPMNTAGAKHGWQKDIMGNKKFYALDDNMVESESWEEWCGIKIKNYHRPLSSYMKCFLENGLSLKFFDEPLPIGASDEYTSHITRMPWFLIMKWQKA